MSYSYTLAINGPVVYDYEVESYIDTNNWSLENNKTKNMWCDDQISLRYQLNDREKCGD